MKSIGDLDRMIADCTRDISDEDVSDTEDPDLMVCSLSFNTSQHSVTL
jgi:hypothetical protein